MVAVIQSVVEQHAQDAAFLCGLRPAYIFAAHMDLVHLARLDEQIAAHLDGLVVAADEGWRCCEGLLESVDAGSIFAATVHALENRRAERLDRLYSIAEAVPEGRGGLLSAFGWMSQGQLQGIGSSLLASGAPFRRYVGLAASSMHRVNPGMPLLDAIRSSDTLLRARAFRTAGEIGRRDLASMCTASVRDDDAACSFWAAWSAVLMGDRATALDALIGFCQSPSAFAERALQMALLAMEVPQAHELLTQLGRNPKHERLLIEGCGLTGDPSYVPWLIGQMQSERVARLAGEAFSTITGLDIDLHDLSREVPESMEGGPNDNPEDGNIQMDLDQDLPWPDPDKLAAWWKINEQSFTKGVRTFMGSPVSPKSCINTLHIGYQRQRCIAALLLALQRPGTVLFEWRAPAWRQKRKLKNFE